MSIVICAASLLLCGCSPDDIESGGSTVVVEYTYTDENRWIYETMSRNYFWREDLPDSLSCDYNLHPRLFFESLLSREDRFSYSSENGSFSRATEDMPCEGFAYQRYVDAEGDTYYQVLYVTSDELRKQGLRRGDFLTRMGADEHGALFRRVRFNNGVASDDGLTIRCDNRSRATSDNSVLLDTIYHIEGRKIGYLCYLSYDEVHELTDALVGFKENNIDHLILDLRYNSGGYVNTCNYLCSRIAPEKAQGEIFQIHEYNDIIALENYRETGDSLTYTYFSPLPDPDGNFLGTPVFGLNMPRLYVITSRRTASASEATIMCLRPYMPVHVIGERTVGKGLGMTTYSTSRCRVNIAPITFRYYNADGVSVPDVGIIPDRYCPDGYETLRRDIGDIREPLLLTTLKYMGVCVDVEDVDEEVVTRSGNIPYLTPLGEPSFVIEHKLKYTY
ncbi:MAG: hypothetical protein IKB15_01455 [Alistipes sp.]|nr:hypothetical protein [Alistipes sp.]